VKADVTAVFHGYADESPVLRDLSDLVNGEMFFEDFCVPSDCQFSAVSGDPVDKGAEVQCIEEDRSQDKNHHQYPEDGGFGTLDEELYPDTEQCQSSQKPEDVFLGFVSKHQLVHQLQNCSVAKVRKKCPATTESCHLLRGMNSFPFDLSNLTHSKLTARVHFAGCLIYEVTIRTFGESGNGNGAFSFAQIRP